MQQQKQVNLRQYQQQYNLLQQPVQLLLSNIRQEIKCGVQPGYKQLKLKQQKHF